MSSSWKGSTMFKDEWSIINNLTLKIILSIHNSLIQILILCSLDLLFQIMLFMPLGKFTLFLRDFPSSQPIIIPHLHKFFLASPLTILPIRFLIAHILQQPLNRRRKELDRRWKAHDQFLIDLCSYFSSPPLLSSSGRLPPFGFFCRPSISWILRRWLEGLNRRYITWFVLSQKFVSLLVYLFFDVDFIFFDLHICSLSFEFIAGWKAVLILASITIIWAAPIPSIFILFHCF